MEVKSCALHVPPLKELADHLQAGLGAFYGTVAVSVEQPDPALLHSWGVAAGGLGGGANPGDATGVILDIGGVNNIHFTANHDVHHWEVSALAKVTNIDEAFLLGAGASSYCWHDLPSLPPPHPPYPALCRAHPVCGTHSAAVHPETGQCILQKHATDPSYRSLINVYASKGQPCDAIKVEVKGSLTQNQSLVSSMRKVLRAQYPSPGANVALGGVFRVVEGAVRSHIMPGYPAGNLDTTDQVNQWLKFYQPIAAPLTCMSVQVAHDKADWELRTEHTHFFGATEGGHYHYDVTPDTIHYIGYFVPATHLYRVDQSRPPVGGATVQPH